MAAFQTRRSEEIQAEYDLHNSILNSIQAMQDSLGTRVDIWEDMET